MANRVRVTGRLMVYRDGYIKQRLCAELVVGNERFYYYPAPKCFDDIITDGTKNKAWVEVTIDKNGKNPRNPKLIRVVD